MSDAEEEYIKISVQTYSISLGNRDNVFWRKLHFDGPAYSGATQLGWAKATVIMGFEVKLGPQMRKQLWKKFSHESHATLGTFRRDSDVDFETNEITVGVSDTQFKLIDSEAKFAFSNDKNFELRLEICARDIDEFDEVLGSGFFPITSWSIEG